MLSKLKKIEFKISVSFIIKAIAFVLFALICITAYSYGKESGFGTDIFVSRSYEYTESGNAKIIETAVEDITVNWYNGEVVIKYKSSPGVKIYETSNLELKDEEVFFTTLDSTELIIDWNEEGAALSAELGKRLTIELPVSGDIDSITVNGVNSDIIVEKLISDYINLNTGKGNITFANVNSEEATVKTSSGKIYGKNSKLEYIKVRSTDGSVDLLGFSAYTLDMFSGSGDLKFTGDFCELSAKTYSGNIEAETSYKPHDINISSTSGNIDLSLPSNISAYGEYKTESGKFETNFVFKSDEEGIIEVNAEEHDLYLTTSSGNIKLNKGNKSSENYYFKELLDD